MKYPIGIQTFGQIINGQYVYVDKTGLIYKLVTSGKVYFLGRPRRFGKSLLVSTLENYFLGNKDLFKGLAIDSLEHEWKKHPVFHIDFSVGDYNNEYALEQIINDYLSRWELLYNLDSSNNDLGLRFKRILHAAHEQTGMGAVVLVDEYDKPILDVMDQGYQVEHLGKVITLEEKHRNIMKSFYSTFKGADADLRFVFLTGVTSQIDGILSDCNYDDISYHSQYNAICGFTQDEIKASFSDLLFDSNERIDESLEKLCSRYGGYHFGNVEQEILNPASVCKAFMQMNITNFWTAENVADSIKPLLPGLCQNIRALSRQFYSDFRLMLIENFADSWNILSVLFQYGILAIRDIDSDTGAYFVDVPNEEVKEFLKSM